MITIKAIAGTSILIAHGSMYPEQSQTDENRKKIASVGTIFGIIASIFALLLPLWVQSLLADPENVKWWEPSGKVIIFYIPLIGIIFAIIGLLGMIFSFFSVDESFHGINFESQKEKLSFKELIHQMNIPAKDKKFRKYIAFIFFTGISGRIVGLVIIPFLIYVLKFRGTDYFIYVIVSFSCKFGWYFFWKKILRKQALIRTYSMCTAVAVITSFLELFFLIEILNFEVKIALFIISYGTVLGCMYAFGIFGGPLFSELVYEAAVKTENENVDEAVSAISGAYVGLSTFLGSLAPAVASILIGITLTGSNQESAVIITLCLCSTGIFYLIALLYLRKIKLEIEITEIKPIITEPKSEVFVE
jgi:Na+/melibiose symporter-like transporter